MKDWIHQQGEPLVPSCCTPSVTGKADSREPDKSHTNDCLVAVEERVQKKILPETQAVRSGPAPGTPK